MTYRGFCGPSNPSQSVIADCERTVNWYPERVESEAAPTGAALYPTPGLRAYVTVPKVGTRGMLSTGGQAFAVVGDGFYELFETRTATLRGTVAQDQNPATLSYNGVTGGQILITSGNNAYCYTLASHAFVEVLTGEALMGGMLDARFLVFDAALGKVRASALNDGTTWPVDVFFQRSQAPDPWKAMVVRPPEIWMIGEKTGEVFYDSGAFPQPFAPIGGALFPYGTSSPFSVTVAGGAVSWLAHADAGAGTIVAATGYTPREISNYAVATALAAYDRAGTMDRCEAWAYQDQGHLFGVYSFADAPGTWVVDMTTGQWHERGEYSSVLGRYGVWAPRVHMHAFGKHLVGERSTGVISEMNIAYATDAAGNGIRRLRIGPPLYAKSRQRLTVSRFEVLAEMGLGLSAGQGVDPQVMLRTSPDGKRWSSERMASAGAQGQFGRECFWTRLGSSTKLWVPEVTVSDPIPWRLSGAEIEGDGFQQLQRGAA